MLWWSIPLADNEDIENPPYVGRPDNDDFPVDLETGLPFMTHWEPVEPPPVDLWPEAKEIKEQLRLMAINISGVEWDDDDE